MGRKAREDQGNLGRRNKGEGCQQGQKELRKKAVGFGSESWFSLERESCLWRGRGYLLWDEKYGMVTARQIRQVEENHPLTKLSEI